MSSISNPGHSVSPHSIPQYLPSLTMLHVFGGLKQLFSVSTAGTNPQTEGFVSKLHYRLTALIFLVCCILVTSAEFVGNGVTISCIQDGHPEYWAIPYHVMNTYCFIMGTFTLPKYFSGEVGKHVIHPGVGEYNEDRDEVEYKSYYQWVPFVLFLQACVFYVPHVLFKIAEGGKVSGIISGLHQTEAVIHDQMRVERFYVVAKYFVKTINTHNVWAFRMLICEVLAFINVVCNIYFIDIFLEESSCNMELKLPLFLEMILKTGLTQCPECFQK